MLLYSTRARNVENVKTTGFSTICTWKIYFLKSIVVMCSEKIMKLKHKTQQLKYRKVLRKS